MLSRSFAAAFIALLLLFSGCASNDGTAPAVATGEAPPALINPLRGTAPQPKPVEVVHRIEVRLDPATHGFACSDTLRLREPAAALDLLLHEALSPVAGCGLVRNPDGDLADHGLRAWRLTADAPRDEWLVAYEGDLFQDVGRARFSRENVGGEIRATVSDQGIYLSGGAGWYPLTGDGLASFRVTTILPEGWKSVTQGRRVHESAADGWTRWTWDAPLPSDGLNLVAAKFRVDARLHGDTSVETWFFPEDSTLAGDYLDACERFLDLYESFLTPYPYPRFAVVENFFPTGYGMPGWTLLGQRVLRLPFIKHISLGHEIAHNWWGNSVFVGEGGNWCEGITVYCADYLYKEMESPAAATQYRRDLLKDYTRYTRDGGDFPLTDFVSRHNAATRSVGYGKSMMVFHALDELVGRDAFHAALRHVVTARQWSEATWSDFFRAVEIEGGLAPLALEEERIQWIEKPGAAELELGSVSVNAEGDGWVTDIEIEQMQPGEMMTLRVPVRLALPGGDAADATLAMETSVAGLRMRTAERPTAVTVDPDCHVFRRLHEAEMESTLGLILADESPAFVLQAGLDDGLAAAARDFAAAWVEGEPRFIAESEVPGFDGTVIWFGTRAPAFRPAPEDLHQSELFTAFGGQRFEPGDYALVYTGKRRGDRGFMAVLAESGPQIAAIASRAPHYGKYSYLGFAGGRNVLKGNWPAAGGPLHRRLD